MQVAVVAQLMQILAVVVLEVVALVAAIVEDKLEDLLTQAAVVEEL
jgi:hypothetical protein